MSLGGTGIGKAFNFINDPLGILPSDVSRILFDPAGIFAEADIIATDTPDPQKSLMSAEIGGPIADCCGTTKITAQLLAFGKERNEITYSEAQSGGKGAPEQPKQATGRKYYMTWQVGILACPDNPVDALYAIYKNDDIEPVWSGELLNPVSGGEETIVLEGVGSLTFYFGTDDQVANSSVGEIIKDSTLNSPLRYHCWAVFDDCYIGETNRVPTYKFVLQKNPIIPELFGPSTIQKYRVNPAHVMWYILHTLAGLPTSWLNEDAFNILADTLLFEDRGMCVQFNRQQSALSFLENINGHIDNILLYNTDGQFHPKLIRDDYVFDDLPVVTESDMLSDPSISSVSFIDTINEVKVQFPEIYNKDGDINPDVEEAYLFGATSLFLFGAYFDGSTLSALPSTTALEQGGSAITNYKNQIVRMNGFGSAARFYLYDSLLNNTDIVDPQATDTKDLGNLINGESEDILYLTDNHGGMFGFNNLVQSGGGPAVYPGNPSKHYSQYFDGHVYISEWQSPTPKMNKIKTSDYSTIYRTNGDWTTYTWKFAILLEEIYCTYGLSGVELDVKEIDTYNHIWNLGGFSGAILQSDIVIVDLYALMVTGTYLYKINTVTMAVSSVLLTQQHTSIIKINSQYVMLFSGREMAVYDIISMTLVDQIGTGISDDADSVAIINI